MSLRRSQLRLAAIIASLAFVLLLAPLLMWRSARADAVDAELDANLLWAMDDVQSSWIGGRDNPDHSAWYVNIADGWADPFEAEPYLEPPLLTWMRDTGEFSSFRDYSVDGEKYRAYIRPADGTGGFVVIQYSGWRDDEQSSLFRRTLLIAAAGAVLAGLAGWFIARMAVRPAATALRERQGFLADAAHEMRTPLAVILASSSQALARQRSSEDYVRSLAEIRSAAERASSGVNELLELARLDSGQAIPRLAPLRLDLLAEEIASSVRTDDCEIVADPTDAVVVQADMPLLRQALDNVVRNAVRRSTRVELRTTAAGRDGIVTITDNGPGFDENALTNVFDRYQRGDRKGDVGIGLAIVKAIVTAHGGEVSARNADGTRNGAVTDTSGAVVEVRIPLAATP